MQFTNSGIPHCTLAAIPVNASCPYQQRSLTQRSLVPSLSVLLCLRCSALPLQFVSTVYGASTTAATFTTTVTSTATKRVGYAYVTTGTSSLSALPSSALWTVETNTIGNATTVC